jgi:hypothetical protein
MDISEVVPVTFKLPIKHPRTGNLIGLTIELAGTNDDKFKAVERNVTDQVMKKRARGKVLTAEEIEENTERLISSTIVGWEWTADADGRKGSFGGEQLGFTPANVAKIVAVTWIRSQIDDALAEQSHFFRS